MRICALFLVLTACTVPTAPLLPGDLGAAVAGAANVEDRTTLSVTAHPTRSSQAKVLVESTRLLGQVGMHVTGSTGQFGWDVGWIHPGGLSDHHATATFKCAKGNESHLPYWIRRFANTSAFSGTATIHVTVRYQGGGTVMRTGTFVC